MAKKILVIDDDEAFVQLLNEACAGAGYVVEFAQNGKDGLELAKSFRPDVLLLDIMMPGMHGFEVCSTIRADIELAHIKIIIISAKGYQFDKTNAMAAGADHYLVKPFRLPALFALLP